MRALFCTVAALASSIASAESTKLTLDAAIDYAVAHHPAVRGDLAAERAATLDVQAERARYVPEVELFAELLRSTANSVPGAVYPLPGLPTITGMMRRVFDDGHWGSALGVTARWDALGFRTWDAAIDRARAELRLARHESSANRLEIEYAAADRFILVLGRIEAVKAARAGVDRAQVFLSIVQAVVGSALRAGADQSRAEAELALAQTAAVRAEAALEISRADLAEALGAPALRVDLVSGGLANAPPSTASPPAVRDPRLAVALARTEVAHAQRELIAAAVWPKLLLVGTVWGRGNGEFRGPADFARGAIPDVPNWALGTVFTWPVFASFVVDPQTRAATVLIHRAQAQADQISQQLQSRVLRAAVIVEDARRVASKTPLAVKAARDTEQQVIARYKAQLATADDVAQVQRLLVQAETEDALARLDVWRALLFLAYAGGDLAPFLAAYHGTR